LFSIFIIFKSLTAAGTEVEVSKNQTKTWKIEQQWNLLRDSKPNKIEFQTSRLRACFD